MFPQQSLKKLAPFIVGGTYTVTNANNATVAVVRSAPIPNTTTVMEEWVMASGQQVSLDLSGQGFTTRVTLNGGPDHLPWPGTTDNYSKEKLTISRTPYAATSTLEATVGQQGGVRFVTTSTSVRVQNGAPSDARDLLTQPVGGTTKYRTETLKNGAGGIVGHVYAEWDGQDTSPLRIWQVMTAVSYAPGGVASFEPGVPSGVQGSLTLSSWYTAAVARLGAAAGLVAISGIVTRKTQ